MVEVGVACGSVEARVAQTVVHGLLAEDACEADGADAGEF